MAIIVAGIISGGIKESFAIISSYMDTDKAFGKTEIELALSRMSPEEKWKLKEESLIDPDKILIYMEKEDKSVLEDKLGKKIIETAGNTTYEDYLIPYREATYQYRIPWQLLQAIDCFAKIQDEQRAEELLQIDTLMPRFEYQEGKYKKTIIEKVKTIYRTYKNGVEEEKREEISVKKIIYPLAYIDRARTLFKEYIFEYKQGVVTQDTGWHRIQEETIISTRDIPVEKTAIEYIEEINQETGEVIKKKVEKKRIEYDTFTTTEEKERSIEVIEDCLVRTLERDNAAVFMEYVEKKKLTVTDLEALHEILIQIPNTPISLTSQLQKFIVEVKETEE